MNLGDLARPLTPRSTPDVIAEALRDAIARGLLKEGQFLRQDEIATQFGVSRIPVREALKQLEGEGLLTLQVNRGAMVSVLSPQEAQEIFEIRSALETTALEFAIPHLQPQNLATADQLLASTDQTTDPSRLAQLNWEFHQVLYQPCDRPRLLALIKTLHVTVERYVRLQLQAMNYLERSQIEHYQILEYCRKGETSKAVQCLKQHIDQAGVDLVHYLNTRSHPS